MEISIETTTGIKEIEKFYGNCPHCHNNIEAIAHFAIRIRNNNSYEVLLACQAPMCSKSFIGLYYISEGKLHYHSILTSEQIKTKKFSDPIVNLSPLFSSIYNEAYQAEQHGLLKVCGSGYRKALEFLIKDYLGSKSTDEKDKIKDMTLKKSINVCFKDDIIKIAAHRAAWLGNDETHYFRIWKDKNLSDFKNLIDVIVHWIEMELLTDEFEVDMPDGKK